MPVQPNLLERTAFFTLNAAPGVLFDLAGALGYQAVSTAVKLGLFHALTDRPLTLQELAQKLGAQERGLSSLLEALNAIGYVDQKNGRCANSKMTQKWLVGSGAFDSESLLNYWDAIMRDLGQYAPDVIRTGERPYNFYEWVESTPEIAHSFQKTMAMTALDNGPAIAKIVKMPDAPAHLLDVGGGHGMYSIGLCEHYPRLKATILDSPTALDIAKENVSDYKVSDRIKLKSGDLWSEDWGEGYDLILLFNMLHHFDEAANLELLQKAFTALKPGGRVAIMDQIAGKLFGSATNAFIRLIALQFYLLADGRVYSHDDLNRMLEQSSFRDIQFHKLPKAPGTSLMTAEKG